MKSRSKFQLFTLSIMAVACFSLPAIAEDKLHYKATEVAAGLYMLQGVGGFAGGNIGLSVGSDGVVMIDDAMPSTLDILKLAIAKITDKPIDYLINTHIHGDHTGNNQPFSDAGAHIVAHENVRERFLANGYQTPEGMQKAPKAVLPVISYTSGMTFHLNGEDAIVIHVANAHTDGDSIVHFKTADVIHTGDTFFNGMYPYIDVGNGGSVDGYIAAQKKILSIANDKTKIIPGHGPLANKANLAADVKMLEEVRAVIASLIAQGKKEDEVVASNPLKKFDKKWSWGFITSEKMARQVYQSLVNGVSTLEQHRHSTEGHSH